MKTPLLLLLAGITLGAASFVDDDEKAAAARSQTRAAVGYLGESTLVLPVGDLDRALAYYQDSLGFDLIFANAEIGFAEVATPTKGLAIGLSQQPDGTHGDTALTLGVKDMDAARKALEKRGVKFAGDVTVYPGLVKLSDFSDPWGNKLTLHQSLSQGE